MEPRGLQVIDEYVYSDTLDMEALRKKADELSSALHKLKSVFISAQLYEADIKRAMYKDVVRIYTLQLTGFDTPGSLQGIDNAIYNFKGMQEVLLLLTGDHHPMSSLIDLMQEAEIYLSTHSDFEHLDRVHFYKHHVSTILKNLSQWETNDWPVWSRNPSEKWGINYGSEHLFSTTFFNLDYYAQLPKEVVSHPDVITLGEKLFYDPILSGDGVMSCATCHQPEKAFTDGLKTSVTNKEGIYGLRNTPTLVNALFTKGYFYDLREEDPGRQIVHVVKDENEFNSDFIDIMDRLASVPEYKTLFQKTFPDTKISKYSITSAITAYVASLSSFDSSFDMYMRDEISEIDPKVIRGFNIFAGKAACATCHFIPTFSGLVPGSFKESESEVLGVPEIWTAGGPMSLDPDMGRIASGKPHDEAPHLAYSFKTTTVRNVSLTAPYMHNGAFAHLKEVMDFYNKGGGAGIGIDLEYQTLSSDPLDLTEEEISDVISFMEALTSLVASPGNVHHQTNQKY
jgi:cytochrome c peroxidase